MKRRRLSYNKLAVFGVLEEPQAKVEVEVKMLRTTGLSLGAIVQGHRFLIEV